MSRIGITRVEQRLVAELRAAAFLDALDGRREHLVEVLERDARAVLAERAPARMKPVPQIGPEQPPTCFVMIMLILSRNAPIELRSRSFQSCSMTRKPVASETPKSASPAKRVELAEVLLVLERRGRDRLDRRLDVRQGDFFHFFSSPRLRPSTMPRVVPRSPAGPSSVTSTLGGSPSSGTTCAAPREVFVDRVGAGGDQTGMPAPSAASRPLRLSSITTQSRAGRPRRCLASS